MKKIIYIIMAYYVAIGISCKDGVKDDVLKDYPTIPLEFKNGITFLEPDSLLGEKIILPLETTAESIIGNIDKLEIAHDT